MVDDYDMVSSSEQHRAANWDSSTGLSTFEGTIRENITMNNPDAETDAVIR